MAQGLYLSQKMSLHQVLAPQLQQSLALLQAPTLELKALVEQELQQNPLLEEVPNMDQDQDQDQDDKMVRDSDTAVLTRGDTQMIQQSDPAEPPADLKFDPASEKQSSDPVDDFQAEFEKLTQLDQEWRDHFSASSLPSRSAPEDEERRQFMFDSLTTGTSLQEHLLEQVRLSEMTDEQRSIAELIVGNLDEYGHLKLFKIPVGAKDPVEVEDPVMELSFSTAIPAEKIAEVLKIVQTFDPVGVGARNLRECLLLQFERQGREKTLECRIVRDFMEQLAKRRMPEIARATGEDVIDVQEAVARISLMEPRPGRAFLPDNDQYILAEIFVTKVEDEYVVTNNNEQIPHLRISITYKDLMAQADSNAEVREYIREKIRAGKFLIKSLHQRQTTILNIAKEIVKRQRDFMEQGVPGLKPLTMVQVAEVVGVHETTVSRAVSGKYMQTPQGIFEMKYFFTSGIQTASGEGMSNTTVKEIVAELFSQEDPFKPISDQEIVLKLAEKGIVIARRTVAKYRSELNILPSNLRKVY